MHAYSVGQKSNKKDPKPEEQRLETGSVNVGIIIFLGVKSVMLVIGISRLIRLKKNPSKRNLKELKKIELGEELSSRRVKLTQETYAIW